MGSTNRYLQIFGKEQSNCPCGLGSNPFEGVAAETAGAITLFLTENLKIPVSTTHTITGSIIGVGATKRLSAVRWGVTINLLWAWVLTIPISALLAGIVYYIFNLFQ